MRSESESESERAHRIARSGGNENSNTKGVKITILGTRSCGSRIPCT